MLMNRVAIVVQPVTKDHSGEIRVLVDQTVYKAKSAIPDGEFMQNELVKICRIEDNVAYCQRGMLDKQYDQDIAMSTSM
ncbi:MULTISPECIES: hypothetical protein [Aerococcus]|jgi:membrane protein implicated in regulation of membrane protease activity|uniref:Uncharacterized protein n=1 Tax=Aerococcus agrisoli TaxID=2487350 RepID=A0A3N4HFK2_9LACT|nr:MULTISPECIES: hypothetical protein [Aerococcus]OYQ67521.1 hypothetical protein B9P78_03415 [Aerococcus sp. 1KP-2016]OYW69223.1 MAG: hypothetical protein B7Z25_06195 [Aerococcus viridans]RPA65504.1 hypothetical protein EF384_00425 [Aerococcus agrisoli]